MRKLMMLLCMVMAVVQLYAQSRTITGKVTDNSGNPISNATIKVKGSTIGTTSDNSGNFRLTIPPTAKTLVISYIGFGDQEVAIGAQTSYNVSLAATSGSLDEVVVQVPYGTVKKTAFTGSEATVSAKQIERQKVTSVTKALEGLAPGIQATNGGGTPGSGAAILIRGFSSFSASTTPLYIVNGAPYDGLITGIANEDIESVTILKDATASALYGARAAAGVIMITTKTGKRGKANVTASFNQGFMSRGIPEYDRLSSKDYYELMWEATRNSFVYGSGQSFATAGQNASAVLTGPTALVYNAYNVPGNQLVDPVTGKLNPNAQLRWTDSWEDVLFRTANRVNANVSVSGAAGEKTNYYISMGYLKEEGTMKFTGYERFTFRSNLNTEATNYLRMGINLDASYANRNDVIGSGSATSNPFYYTRNMGPIYPVYWYDVNTGALMKDANGNPMLDWGTPSQMGTRPYAGNSNLLGSLELDERSNKRFNGNLAPYIEISLHKNLTFKTTLAVNIWEDNATTYQNNMFGDAAGVKGRSTKTFDRQMSMTMNQVLTWSKKVKDHAITALAGHESYSYKYNYLTATRTGFPLPGTAELSNAGVTEGQPTSIEDNATLESFFANVNYSFKERYLLSANVRRDGSSRFAPNVRWGNFYSAGIGWRISQEDFLKNVNWINDLKFKASYGEVGQQDIGVYYQYNDWFYNNALGQYLPNTSRKANPDLVWEKSIKFNVGFDFALFKNRLQGTIEYFRNTNKDLLFDVPQPPSIGQFVYQNVGANRNSGIEIQLGYNAIRKKNFDWRVDFNITTYKNVMTDLAAVHKKTGGFVNGTKKIMLGYDQQQFWLREFAGVDAATGEALYYLDILDATGKPTGERGLTNDITKATFYAQGTAIPKFNGGVTNSFRYKNFDLSILVTYAYGGKFYDGNYAGLMHFGSYGTAWHSDILNRWQKPGDVTNVPRVQNAVGATQEGASTRWLFDASYINIKNISLTYNLSKSIASKLKLSGLQVYANIDNVKLFAAKKGMDPQRSFAGTADASYPPFRTITFGLTANL